MSEVNTPDWVKHAVFYQIFPDRFAKSERLQKPNNLEPWDSAPTTFGYKGGDLYGVLEQLDYIQELGVTALYFNPIFQSASNHRYHTHDYYLVDPLLGGNEAFDALLAECKRRGLRVVLDGVFNHCSRGFFQFNDILENGAASPWLDWFYVTLSEDDRPINAYDHSLPPDYTAWVGLHALPKFNTDNPQVREYLMQVGEYWVRKGIDGWRLDVANEITTPGFWQEFRQRIKAVNPEAYIVAEIWEESQQWLQGDQFDAVMNYPLTEALIGYAGQQHVRIETISDRSYYPKPNLSAEDFAARVERLLSIYPWPVSQVQLNLLDSHDTARFFTIVGENEASFRLASLLMFALPGAPSVYYGDEVGVTGGRPDAFARWTFPWDRPEAWNRDLLAFYKQIIALRLAQPALRIGDYRTLVASGTVYAFARTLNESTLVIVANVGDAAQQVDVPLSGLQAAQDETQVLFGTSEHMQRNGDTLHLTLSAQSGIVLSLAPGSLG